MLHTDGFTVSPCFGRCLIGEEGGRPTRSPDPEQESVALFKTLLAILTVLAVVALRGLFRLPLMPFRAARTLLRRRSATA